jgi:hypothetical protein
VRAIDIIWDVDEEDEGSREEILSQLPTEVEIPKGIDADSVADYLSDQTGYCHFGFVLVP